MLCICRIQNEIPVRRSEGVDKRMDNGGLGLRSCEIDGERAGELVQVVSSNIIVFANYVYRKSLKWERCESEDGWCFFCLLAVVGNISTC